MCQCIQEVGPAGPGTTSEAIRTARARKSPIGAPAHAPALASSAAASASSAVFVPPTGHEIPLPESAAKSERSFFYSEVFDYKASEDIDNHQIRT